MNTININGKPVGLKVMYCLAGSGEYFSNWENMIKYWIPYYGSRAELLDKAIIQGFVCTEGCLPLCGIYCPKPLMAEEKKLLIERAIAMGEFNTIENA